MGRFEQVFPSDSLRRDNFLGRLFGIFSEEVVRAWCPARRRRIPTADDLVSVLPDPDPADGTVSARESADALVMLAKSRLSWSP